MKSTIIKPSEYIGRYGRLKHPPLSSLINVITIYQRHYEQNIKPLLEDVQEIARKPNKDAFDLALIQDAARFRAEYLHECRVADQAVLEWRRRAVRRAPVRR